jgi:hypothetical protein
MGDRGQVRLVSEGRPDIYLYTHWGATELPTDVGRALRRGGSRWGDDEYLNRIIFSELIKDSVLGDTGYGIGTELHGDVWLVVEVNHTNRTVSLQTVSFVGDDYKKLEFKTQYTHSFDDFVEKFAELNL